MPTITADDLADQAKATLKNLGRLKWNDIATPMQEYVILPDFLKRGKVTFASGRSIQKNLFVDLGADTEVHVGLYEEDEVDVGDHMANMEVPWRQVKRGWGFEFRDGLYNRGESLIFNIIKPRRYAAFVRIAQGLETAGWSSPGTSDKLKPFGIPHWVVYDATDGFTGGNPGSWTTKGGIDCTVHEGFCNYSFTYTNPTFDDLLSHLRTAVRKTRWVTPMEVPEYASSAIQRFKFFMGENPLKNLEILAEQQNDRLGSSLGMMQGVATFLRFPLRWVPHLDTVSGSPIYGLDMEQFHACVLQGDYLRETGPNVSGTGHNNLRAFIDLSYNFECWNPRKCFVGATAAPFTYPS